MRDHEGVIVREDVLGRPSQRLIRTAWCGTPFANSIEDRKSRA